MKVLLSLIVLSFGGSSWQTANELLGDPSLIEEDHVSLEESNSYKCADNDDEYATTLPPTPFPTAVPSTSPTVSPSGAPSTTPTPSPTNMPTNEYSTGFFDSVTKSFFDVNMGFFDEDLGFFDKAKDWNLLWGNKIDINELKPKGPELGVRDSFFDLGTVSFFDGDTVSFFDQNWGFFDFFDVSYASYKTYREPQVIDTYFTYFTYRSYQTYLYWNTYFVPNTYATYASYRTYATYRTYVWSYLTYRTYATYWSTSSMYSDTEEDAAGETNTDAASLVQASLAERRAELSGEGERTVERLTAAFASARAKLLS